MAKTVNYTDEQVSKMLEMYSELGNAGIDQIAEAVEKNVRSVRSKLVREGVYVASPRAKAASKDMGPSKKELLNDLENIVGFDVTGFSGATKPAIQELITHLSA
jgi:hypothetical protein|tara:strand:- start:455 stop:766 length:312 start_codon:yes stop_codon:yes gene_type:complete